LTAEDLGEALRQVAEQLCAEMSPATALDVAGIEAIFDGEDLMRGVFGTEDESLVRELRRALVRVAATLGADAEDAQLRRMRAAIDGAEMAARSEILAGNAWRLPHLLPSLVFMVSLSIVEQDRALKLSQRAAELVDQIGSP
jgi:hypothetical protein